MSFAVVHMQKFKVNGVKGIQFHNQRQRDSRTNPDIDNTKSHLNYDLHNKKLIDYNKKIKEIIKNNVITDRAIRKDAVVMCNFVITSDKKFFDTLSSMQQQKFFEISYDFFKKRYGEKNIVACPVHLDEKTPHIHLSLVPVTKDNKLSAKRLFDRKELRSIQDDFPKYLNENGFNLQRGIDAKGKNKHIKTQKFKAMEIEKEVKQLEKQRYSLKNDLKALKTTFKKAHDTKLNFDEINAIEGKYKFLSKDKVTISSGNFKKLKTTAQRYLLLKNQVDDLTIKNNHLNNNLKEFMESRRKEFNQNCILTRELDESQNSIKKLKKQLNWFGDYLQEINKIDDAIEYLHERKKIDIQKQRKEQMKDHDLER